MTQGEAGCDPITSGEVGDTIISPELELEFTVNGKVTSSANEAGDTEEDRPFETL